MVAAHEFSAYGANKIKDLGDARPAINDVTDESYTIVFGRAEELKQRLEFIAAGVNVPNDEGFRPR